VSAFAVNDLCRRVVHDPAFRAELLADPAGATAAFHPPLSEEERSALLAGDVGRLSRLGAHDFQLYQLQRFEMFGITLRSYLSSMKGAYR
jgi:hypothetical protein